MYVKSRTNYNSLKNYNLQKPGTVKGPPLAVSIPSMATEQVLDPPRPPKFKNKYNALTYDSNGQAYYSITSGPYDGPCSKNKSRSCGGPGYTPAHHTRAPAHHTRAPANRTPTPTPVHRTPTPAPVHRTPEYVSFAPQENFCGYRHS